MTITFFRGGIQNVDKPEYVSLEQALEYIRKGQEYEKVRQVRHAADKKKRQALKRGLSYYCFSGRFTRRHNEHCEQHSGLLCLDFDDLGEGADLATIKAHLAADPYCHALFISASGNGLKMLVRILPERHLQCFLALEEYFRRYYKLEVDKSGKDISRACYLSADSKLVHKPGSEVFGDIYLETDYTTGEVIEHKATYNQPEAETTDPLYHVEVVAQRIVEAGRDITQDYNDWWLLACSMASLGQAGRTYFHTISSLNPDYTQRDADAKFDEAVKSTRFTTPGWFFRRAKEAGIDLSVKNKDGKPKQSGTRSARRRMESSIADMDEDTASDYEFIPPVKGLKFTEEQRRMAFKYGHVEINNRTYYAKFSEHTVSFEKVANFGMKPLYLILSKTEAKRIMEIHNEFGNRKVIDVPSRAFVSVTEFSQFVESEGNFWQNFTKAQFQKIKARLYDQTRDAEEVRTLGWHKAGFYAFANGIMNGRFSKIDEHGMVTHEVDGEERTYFLPALSSIYRSESELYDTEKKLVYVKRNIGFAEWSELFIKVHKKNGWLALNFYVAALFRDFIYGQQKFFPHLFLFGPPGTGKSNLAWSLMYMFGLERKPFLLTAGTQVGFHRTFAQMVNGLVWFDEYQNTIDWKRIQDLKGAYDGSGHVKGEYNASSSSNKTVTTPIHSACVVSGQELPTADNALFKRTILLQYYQTEYSEEERQANDQLKRLQEKGLSEITGDIVRLRSTVEERYPIMLDRCKTALKKALAAFPNIESRIIENAAQVLAIYPTLEKEIPWPYSYEEIEKEWVEAIKAQNALIASAKETSTFWETVAYLVFSALVKEGDDYAIKTISQIRVRSGRGETETKSFDQPREVIYLRLARIHPLYLEAQRKQGQKAGMDQGSLKHYLTHSKEFLGAIDNHRFANGPSSAFVFDYTMLKAQGYHLQIVHAPEGAASENEF